MLKMQGGLCPQVGCDPRTTQKPRRDACATADQQLIKRDNNDSGPDGNIHPVALGWLWSETISR